MATKKTTKKADITPTKSVEEVSKSILDIQQRSREALITIDSAFASKIQEYNDLTSAINAKKEELAELGEKELVEISLKELQEKFADAKHEHARSINRLKIELADERAALQKSIEEDKAKYSAEMEDEDRQRKISLEDENRKRQLAYEEIQKDYAEREAIIEKKEAELGSFDDRLKKATQDEIRSVIAEHHFKEHKMNTEFKSEIKILQSQVEQLEKEKSELYHRLHAAEDAVKASAEKAQAIALTSLNTEAGKEALKELRTVAHRQAESRK